MSTSDNQDESGTNAPAPDAGTARPNMQSMLSLILTEREAAGHPLALPPKSIHQVVHDILDEYHTKSNGHTGETIYVEPEYSLSAAGLIFIQAELSNYLGPAVQVDFYQHHKHQDHVIIKFKA